MRKLPAMLLLAGTVTVAACSSGGGGGAQSAGSTVTVKPGETVTIEGKVNNTFSVREIDTTPGDLTINLTVGGGTPHNLEVEGIANAKIPLISGGESKTITFPVVAGTYSYVCTIHSGMDGKIVVTSAQ